MTPKTLDDISEWAARKCAKDDYQVAQNEAYAAAIGWGYTEQEAEDCAHHAGVIHGDLEYWLGRNHNLKP